MPNCKKPTPIPAEPATHWLDLPRLRRPGRRSPPRSASPRELCHVNGWTCSPTPDTGRWWPRAVAASRESTAWRAREDGARARASSAPGSAREGCCWARAVHRLSIGCPCPEGASGPTVGEICTFSCVRVHRALTPSSGWRTQRASPKARSSVGEHYLDTVGVRGSIPRVPTNQTPQPCCGVWHFRVSSRSPRLRSAPPAPDRSPYRGGHGREAPRNLDRPDRSRAVRDCGSRAQAAAGRTARSRQIASPYSGNGPWIAPDEIRKKQAPSPCRTRVQPAPARAVAQRRSQRHMITSDVTQ